MYILASVLSQGWVTGASPLSLNNDLGVPLTLVNAPGRCEALVVEMGARGRRHIASLCEVARPTVGVVTADGARFLADDDVAPVVDAILAHRRGLPAGRPGRAR
jgi:UDP-N-acetylmuramoyl-tripeptide--D-alanyl-D-alanine ligase